jgi:hypothetical protein
MPGFGPTSSGISNPRGPGGLHHLEPLPAGGVFVATVKENRPVGQVEHIARHVILEKSFRSQGVGEPCPERRPWRIRPPRAKPAARGDGREKVDMLGARVPGTGPAHREAAQGDMIPAAAVLPDSMLHGLEDVAPRRRTCRRYRNGGRRS